MITDCLATTVPHLCVPHSPFDDSPADATQGGATLAEEETMIGAHEGILASSIKVCTELKPLLDEKVPEGFAVQLCGHSLGAGAASVVAVLLRAYYLELHEPNRLHAFCFATPPVLDYRTATKSKDFITAVVNRNDCVARMSIANVEVLIRMLEGLNNKIMKQEGLVDFWSVAKESVFGAKIKELDNEQFAQLVEIMQEAQAAVEIENEDNLYVPGNIIALYGTITELPAEGEEADVVVKAAYVDPAHTFLRYFEINERMLDDHYIPSYQTSLTDCIESHHEKEFVPESESSAECVDGKWSVTRNQLSFVYLSLIAMPFLPPYRRLPILLLLLLPVPMDMLRKGLLLYV